MKLCTTSRNSAFWSSLGVIFDEFWQSLLDVLGADDLRRTEFDRQPGRLASKKLIEDRVAEIFATDTTAHWLAKLEAVRIPCAPVNRFSQALADPQVRHRDMVVEVGHPDGGRTFAPAPTLGQHS